MKIKRFIIFFIVVLASLEYPIFSQVEQNAHNALPLTCSTKFKIERFEKDSPGPSYRWKIVIGEPISYKASGTAGIHWVWALGNWSSSFTPYWSLLSYPIGSSTFSDLGQAIIPVSSLPLNNSDLGPSHGLVKAFKEKSPGPPPITETHILKM